MNHHAISYKQETERVRELDGLRALAILLVVAWHYIGIVGVLNPPCGEYSFSVGAASISSSFCPDI